MPLSLLRINACSLPKNADNLIRGLSTSNCSFSILGVTETWLHKDNVEVYHIDNYNHVYRYREGRTGGGVSLYINEDIGFSQRNYIEDIFFPSGETTFVETSDNIIKFNLRLANALAIVTREGKNCYLMGDFNITIINSVIHDLTKVFLNTMYSHCFYPVIFTPKQKTQQP